jgi:hypothetical protein
MCDNRQVCQPDRRQIGRIIADRVNSRTPAVETEYWPRDSEQRQCPWQMVPGGCGSRRFHFGFCGFTSENGVNGPADALQP